MRNTNNSLLQQMFIKAKELEIFTLNNMTDNFPNANRKTIARYLIGLIKNGNLEKKKSIYFFINDKPIKVKIGE